MSTSYKHTSTLWSHVQSSGQRQPSVPHAYLSRKQTRLSPEALLRLVKLVTGPGPLEAHEWCKRVSPWPRWEEGVYFIHGSTLMLMLLGLMAVEYRGIYSFIIQRDMYCIYLYTCTAFIIYIYSHLQQLILNIHRILLIVSYYISSTKRTLIDRWLTYSTWYSSHHSYCTIQYSTMTFILYQET